MGYKTAKKAIMRGCMVGVQGALMAFALMPVNLEDPKKYLLALGIGMGTGFLAGLQKAITGYYKYDKPQA